MNTEYFSEISVTLQTFYDIIPQRFLRSKFSQDFKLHGIIVDINWWYFVKKEKWSSCFMYIYYVGRSTYNARINRGPSNVET